jgi:hypothetical protein
MRTNYDGVLDVGDSQNMNIILSKINELVDAFNKIKATNNTLDGQLLLIKKEILNNG